MIDPSIWICAICKEPLANNHKYVALMFSDNCFLAQSGCEHKPVPDAKWNAFVGSQDCLIKAITEWSEGLKLSPYATQ